nr:MAG TPA: hypothetical protein [Caudoviricetes sp.]
MAAYYSARRRQPMSSMSAAKRWQNGRKEAVQKNAAAGMTSKP